MSNETLYSQPCPHCKAIQYFTAESFGKGTECTSCGLKYFAPKSANDDGVKIAPAGAAAGAPPPLSQPAAIPAHVTYDTPQDYLARLRKQTRFGAARGVARIGAILLGVAVILITLGNLAGMAFAPALAAGVGGIVSLGAALILALVIWASYQFTVVIFDIADALIDIGRKMR